MTTALTRTNGNKHLQAYGQRAEIEEISSRLMELHPNAQQLGQPVMTAVAQLAIISGANPMPMSGEIWAWKNWDGARSPSRMALPTIGARPKRLTTLSGLTSHARRPEQERQEAGIR